MTEEYRTKQVGDIKISTQFFGNSFGHVEITRRNDSISLDETEVNDLHYFLGRILYEIEERKRRR